MKYYLLCFILGASAGAFMCFKLSPKPGTTTIVEKGKTITIVKRVKEPNGRETEEIRETKEESRGLSKLDLQPQWYGYMGISHYSEKHIPVYTLGISRRIVGPIWGGIYGNTKKEFGLTLGIEF